MHHLNEFQLAGNFAFWVFDWSIQCQMLISSFLQQMDLLNKEIKWLDDDLDRVGVRFLEIN